MLYVIPGSFPATSVTVYVKVLVLGTAASSFLFSSEGSSFAPSSVEVATAAAGSDEPPSSGVPPCSVDSPSVATSAPSLSALSSSTMPRSARVKLISPKLTYPLASLVAVSSSGIGAPSLPVSLNLNCSSFNVLPFNVLMPTIPDLPEALYVLVNVVFPVYSTVAPSTPLVSATVTLTFTSWSS